MYDSLNDYINHSLLLKVPNDVILKLLDTKPVATLDFIVTFGTDKHRDIVIDRHPNDTVSMGYVI